MFSMSWLCVDDTHLVILPPPAPSSPAHRPASVAAQTPVTPLGEHELAVRVF